MMHFAQNATGGLLCPSQLVLRATGCQRANHDDVTLTIWGKIFCAEFLHGQATMFIRTM